MTLIESFCEDLQEDLFYQQFLSFLSHYHIIQDRIHNFIIQSHLLLQTLPSKLTDLIIHPLERSLLGSKLIATSNKDNWSSLIPLRPKFNTTMDIPRLLWSIAYQEIIFVMFDRIQQIYNKLYSPSLLPNLTYEQHLQFTHNIVDGHLSILGFIEKFISLDHLDPSFLDGVVGMILWIITNGKPPIYFQPLRAQLFTSSYCFPKQMSSLIQSFLNSSFF